MTEKGFLRSKFTAPKQNLYNLLHPQANHSDTAIASTDQALPETVLHRATTADSFMSPISRESSRCTADLYAHCVGKPRTLISSHSGSITVALSVEEPFVFLKGSASGATSYRELGVESDSGSSRRSPAGSSSTNTSSAPSASQRASRPQEALSDQPPATLRGSILLKLTKPTKLKHISLSFFGVSKTVWTQVSRIVDDPANQAAPDIHDTIYVNSHDWEFLPSADAFLSSSAGSKQSSTTVVTDVYGADAAVLKSNPGDILVKDHAKSDVKHSSSTRLVTSDDETGDSTSTANSLPLFAPLVEPRRQLRRHSISNHLTKDSVVFPAGEYVYNFALAIDANTPETVSAPDGSITYFLEAKVVRSGPFSLNLSGRQQVELVRTLPSGCEGVINNPVVVSRIWDNRLFYEIVVGQKHVALGSSIPVAIKLTPVEKVQVHRIRVQLFETIQYRYSRDMDLDSTEVSAKVTLFDRKAQPVTEPESNNSGESEEEAPPAGPSTGSKGKVTKKPLIGNLLSSGGNNEDTDESMASTIECILPLTVADRRPSSHLMPSLRKTSLKVEDLHPDSVSWKYLRIRHRLVVSLRLSKMAPDADKRRYFEVKIDTPIVLLSKYCVDETVSLPQYDNGSWSELNGSNLPSFNDALAAITDDELYVSEPRVPINLYTPSPPPEYSALFN